MPLHEANKMSCQSNEYQNRTSVVIETTVSKAANQIGKKEEEEMN